MRPINYFFLILTLCFSLSNAHAESGENLHETACIECHSLMTGGDGSVLYEREDRIATSMEALEKQVVRCSKGANTGWNSDQINSVINFLNESHYHY